MQVPEIISTIAKDTMEGLASSPKYLSSKYFYDDEGSKIFQRIMRMPEYYLTDCEYEIFEKQACSIASKIISHQLPIELIELGAGDGLKTRLLIKELSKQKVKFRYIPIDISEEILLNMASSLQKEFKDLEVVPKTGDYFDIIKELELISNTPKVILFLGSNIGNYKNIESLEFFRNIRRVISEHDKLIIGFDLKKNPEIILNAYNDPNGNTSDFNLNLLLRLNNELGANFNIENFKHAPLYDPLRGVAKSYIVSTKMQSVYFKELNKTIHFKEWEAIYTERSQKYDINLIQELAVNSGFEIVENYIDSKGYFIDSVWKPSSLIKN